MKLFAKIRMLATWYFWSLLLLNSCSVFTKTPSCSVCKSIVKDFEEGLKRTAKSHFGGGDADWEESRLGSFSTSETRLIEITEELYQGGKDTQKMVEEYEELIEKYWFTEFSKNKNANFHKWFCIENVKACCPENTYGPSCSECTGGVVKPCNGNGDCDGEGTREGTGKCKCSSGYQGDLCDQCADGYYEDTDSETIKCPSCHTSCLNTCSEGGKKGCDECKAGWSWDEDEGCQDVNECERDPPVCSETQYCVNSQGSYTCQECDSSCEGCYGGGNNKCLECNKGYERKDDKCEDVNECTTDPTLCSETEYCENTRGSYECEECDSSCDGCHGSGNDKCSKCNKGYYLEDDKCEDIDECLDKTLCSGENEKCVNTGGSYVCECQDGFERKESRCIKSIKNMEEKYTKQNKGKDEL